MGDSTMAVEGTVGGSTESGVSGGLGAAESGNSRPAAAFAGDEPFESSDLFDDVDSISAWSAVSTTL